MKILFHRMRHNSKVYVLEENYDCYDIGVAVEVQEGWKRRLCLNY